MFKVPDWGNDIPKSDVEVMKLFTKKNRKKNTKTSAQHKTKNNVINGENNHKKKKVATTKNFINKRNGLGRTKLTTDDHNKNRILQRNVKSHSNDAKNKLKTSTESRPTVICKDNKMSNGIDVSSKVKNKVLKRKGKVLKLKPTTGKKDTKLNKINSKDISDKKPQSHKRKQPLNYKKHDNIEISDVDIQSLNSDEPDKILVNAKRKKLNDNIKNDDVEDILFGNKNNNEKDELNKDNAVIASKETKLQKKKEKLKKILKRDSNRNVIKTNSNKLRERMLDRLKAAQFRYLNEKLYTSSGSESQELFKSDPVAFQTYHEGYQLQVKKWPVNPLDLIVKRIQKMPKTHLVADMGCGEAALSKRVPQSVRSFDLVATAPGVEACNMAHTPLLAASMDAVVFCLALMGTDLTQYLLEANRVLKVGGHLLIAEVESRFENVDTFSSDVQRLGFSLKKMDKSHQVFFFMEFSKVRDAPSKRGKLPKLSLKPCLYKRR